MIQVEVWKWPQIILASYLKPSVIRTEGQNTEILSDLTIKSLVFTTPAADYKGCFTSNLLIASADDFRRQLSEDKTRWGRKQGVASDSSWGFTIPPYLIVTTLQRGGCDYPQTEAQRKSA